MTQREDLTKIQYFFGYMTEEQTKRHLKDEGDFLLRLSDRRDPPALVVTVKWANELFSVEVVEGKLEGKEIYSLASDENQWFHTVERTLEYCVAYGLPVEKQKGIKLVSAIGRPKQFKIKSKLEKQPL